MGCYLTMIRWFCEWYLRTFPKKKPEGMYPAKQFWQVAVTLNTDSGKEVKYIEFIEDRLEYLMGNEYWTTAKIYALNKADHIKKNGFTEWVGGLKDHYPVHRVYLVQAYPMSKANVIIESNKDTIDEQLAAVKEAVENLDRNDL